MRDAGWARDRDGATSRHLTAALLVVLLLPPALPGAGPRGFAFTGENCLEAHDLGAVEATTISMWLRIGADPGEELSLLSTHGWDVSALHLLLTEDRRILLTVNGSEPAEVVSQRRAGRRIGDRVHLAVVLDQQKRRWAIYLDGELDLRTRLQAVVPINLNDVRIGAWNVEPRAFVGWMDEIRIYDRALTADEVAALARHGGPAEGVLAWWPLDDTDGDRVLDRSGHEHHAVVREVGEGDDADDGSGPGEDRDEPAPPEAPEVKPVDPVAALRRAVSGLAEQFPAYRQAAGGFQSRIDRLTPRESAGPALAALRYEALVRANPLVDFRRVLFIKRYTLQSTHFYTDFIDGCVKFGGNLSVLDLETGQVTDLIPEMRRGIFGRFDLHFSATRVVFDWKASPQEGFRIYEIDLDPVTGVRTGGPRQLTDPPPDEAARIAKYAHPEQTPGPGRYYHQTDDMHPCYLPDGGIVFTSTRCEYGTLCDAPDILSTTVLYRMDADGSHLEKLTNSSLSEFCPTMLADGRVLYTRWEYVDKGQLGVKCLWAMHPDGTGTTEVYGNDIPFPPTFMYGRQLPGDRHGFVFVGAPHFPQGGSFGTIIRIDTREDIRTRRPMTTLTPNVDVRQEAGWNQLRDGHWQRDERGPLYTDPYPLGRDVYLVSHNPDRPWHDERAYGLYLLDGCGNHQRLYRDPEFTCREPYPLRPRATPPVRTGNRDPKLAQRGLALCLVADVHHGMDGIERGDVKYLRIMEQVPRPWDARRFWDREGRYDDHTHLISEGTALGAKVMWGVVPVADDGSACFYVPADRNIYLQALDANYMELQRERTYVNYRPGETRSCIGCHERPRDVAPVARRPLALRRSPRMPQAQPGDPRPEQVIHYPTTVQPVLDRFCIRCHSGDAPRAGLDLGGERTTHFSRSYEAILKRGLVKTYREASDFGGTHYVPPKTIGSHASRLMARVRAGCPGADALPLWAFVRLATWVDASGVYYGSYWGRRHLRFKDHPSFRPVPTFEEAISTRCPIAMADR